MCWVIFSCALADRQGPDVYRLDGVPVLCCQRLTLVSVYSRVPIRIRALGANGRHGRPHRRAALFTDEPSEICALTAVHFRDRRRHHPSNVQAEIQGLAPVEDWEEVKEAEEAEEAKDAEEARKELKEGNEVKEYRGGKGGEAAAVYW